MNEASSIQIIGIRKNAATRKAIRFFTERGVKPHLLDLGERGLKPRELENITRGRDPMDLIDTGSQAYQKGGFAYLSFDAVEEILSNPLLLKMPVVRSGARVCIGEQPEEWKLFLSGGQ